MTAVAPLFDLSADANQVLCRARSILGRIEVRFCQASADAGIAPADLERLDRACESAALALIWLESRMMERLVVPSASELAQLERIVGRLRPDADTEVVTAAALDLAAVLARMA